jgi:hypothetical protein
MLKKISKPLKIVLLVFAFIFIIGASFFKILDLSFNKYLDKVVSPDGKYYVQTIETNGGATTGFISNVLISTTSPIFGVSNYLSAWTGNRKGIFATNGSGFSIKTVWLNNNILKVTYSDCHKVYGQDKSWKDIKIVYEGKCSAN